MILIQLIVAGVTSVLVFFKIYVKNKKFIQKMKDPGSFRDPSGFIFIEKKIFRV